MIVEDGDSAKKQGRNESGNNVYTLGQRQLRQALQQAQLGIKNQLGKLTERPTLRWIFQCFQAVHLLLVKEVKQVSNLTDERLYILRFFPDACRQYYLLC